MSEVFEFPHQAEGFYRKGMALIKQQQYAEAVPFLIKSYRLEPDTHVLDDLVKSLIVLNHKTDLKDIWEEFFPELTPVYEDEWLLTLYTISVPLIFPLNAALLTLYQIKDHVAQHSWDAGQVSHLITQLNTRLAMEQRMEQAIQHQQVDAFVSQLISEDTFQLLSHIKYMYELPFDRCEPVYYAMLRQSGISQYIKSDLLHYLIFQKVHQTIDYNWFGEMHQLDIATLQTYQQQANFASMQQLIEDYCEQYNPHLFMEFIQQFTLHALTLFPFFDKVFPIPNTWFNLFLEVNGFDFDERFAATDTQFHYFDKVNEALQEFLLHEVD